MAEPLCFSHLPNFHSLYPPTLGYIIYYSIYSRSIIKSKSLSKGSFSNFIFLSNKRRSDKLMIKSLLDILCQFCSKYKCKREVVRVSTRIRIQKHEVAHVSAHLKAKSGSCISYLPQYQGYFAN